MKRDGFIFYKSFKDAISELPDEQRLQIYDAIIEYGIDGKIPEKNGIVKTIFTLIKPQIDANNKKYENGLKGAEHGAKGGRPKKEKTPKKPLKNPLGDNGENPKETPKEKEKVNVNVKVNDNDKIDMSDHLPVENENDLPPDQHWRIIKFDGLVMKINRRDFEKWHEEYGGTFDQFWDFLVDRDDWLNVQPKHIQKNWFMSTKNYIEKLSA